MTIEQERKRAVAAYRKLQSGTGDLTMFEAALMDAAEKAFEAGSMPL